MFGVVACGVLLLVVVVRCFFVCLSMSMRVDKDVRRCALLFVVVVCCC